MNTRETMRALPLRGPSGRFCLRATMLLIVACLLWLAHVAPARAALDQALLSQLGSDDPDIRVAAVRKIGASAEPRAAAVLQAIASDALAIVNNRAVIVS